MAAIVRSFRVEIAEPGFGALPKRHVVLGPATGKGDEVLHLWTGDQEIINRLVPGATVDLVVASQESAPRG